MNTLRGRLVALAAGLLSATLFLTACGGNGTSGADTEATSDAATSGYPVTLETQYGAITLDEKPERVVVLGSALAVDVLAGLDERPAVFGTGFATEQEALVSSPWIEGLYGEYRPGLITTEWAPSAEAIAAADPDLIVFFGAGSPLDETGYAQLSEIAPVYAYRSVPEWQNAIADFGTLTGKTEQAQQVTEDITAEFAAARERIAGLQGRTGLVGQALPDGSVYTFPAGSIFLEALGLVPAENMPAATDRPTEISAENLDQLSADVVLLTGAPQEGSDRLAIEDDPRYGDLPAVRNGTLISLYPLIGNVPPTQIGPASVPWFLERILPELEKSPLNAGG